MSEQSPRTGNLAMADVSGKPRTARRALAVGRILVGQDAFEVVARNELPKGDARSLAEVAGILGAKRTPDLLPLCHPIALSRVVVRTILEPEGHAVAVYCLAEIEERTGVEMEALTGASIALLTLWDLTKPLNAALEIDGVRLLYKSGGKQGEWRHPSGLSEAELSLLGLS
jgi:molybdenum cofactor biosynthesis protein MoaC